MPSDASRSRFGVLPAMMPWLYAPMLAQPMSSPMMRIMLGLLCCAVADPATRHSTAAIINESRFIARFICITPFQGRIRHRKLPRRGAALSSTARRFYSELRFLQEIPWEALPDCPSHERPRCPARRRIVGRTMHTDLGERRRLVAYSSLTRLSVYGPHLVCKHVAVLALR